MDIVTVNRANVFRNIFGAITLTIVWINLMSLIVRRCEPINVMVKVNSGAIMDNVLETNIDVYTHPIQDMVVPMDPICLIVPIGFANKTIKSNVVEVIVSIHI